MLPRPSTALNIYDNSLIKVSNGNNSYQNNASYTYTNASNMTNSYATSTNTISCGAPVLMPVRRIMSMAVPRSTAAQH